MSKARCIEDYFYNPFIDKDYKSPRVTTTKPTEPIFRKNRIYEYRPSGEWVEVKDENSTWEMFKYSLTIIEFERHFEKIS